MAEETPRQAVSHVTVNGRRVAIYSPTPDLWQTLFNFKDDLNNDNYPREDVRWAVVNAVISYCSDGDHLLCDDNGPHRFPLANWTERRLQLVSAIVKTWDRSYYCNALFAGLVLGCARRIALELKIRMRFYDLIINPHPEMMSKAFKDGLASAGVILPTKPEVPTDRQKPPAAPDSGAVDPADRQPLTSTRMIVRRNPPSITLDEIPYGVTVEQSVFVDVLFRSLGNWVEPAVFEKEPMLKGERRDRIKKTLPKPILGLIQSKPGGGYKMTLA